MNEKYSIQAIQKHKRQEIKKKPIKNSTCKQEIKHSQTDEWKSIKKTIDQQHISTIRIYKKIR